MTTTHAKLASGESLDQTQDLHIVIAAIGGRANDVIIGYTAVSAPLDWHAAQKLWDTLDHERRAGVRVTGAGRYQAKGHIKYLMVRSVNDPRWTSLISRGYANAVGRDGRPGRERGIEKAAKAWAKDFGYQGAGGGWIYDPSGKPFIQGWGGLADILRRRGAISQGSDGRWYVLDREMVAA